MLPCEFANSGGSLDMDALAEDTAHSAAAGNRTGHSGNSRHSQVSDLLEYAQQMMTCRTILYDVVGCSVLLGCIIDQLLELRISKKAS